MDYYQESIDKAKDIAKHEKYGRHPKVLEFLERFEKKRSAWKAKVDEQEMVKAIRDSTDNALMNLSHAKTYFDSGREGQAMDYFQKAEEYAKQVGEDTRFVGRKEIPEFFEKFNSRAASFKQHYREVVLSKEIRDVTSVNQTFSNWNQMANVVIHFRLRLKTWKMHSTISSDTSLKHLSTLRPLMASILRLLQMPSSMDSLREKSSSPSSKLARRSSKTLTRLTCSRTRSEMPLSPSSKTSLMPSLTSASIAMTKQWTSSTKPSLRYDTFYYLLAATRYIEY